MERKKEKKLAYKKPELLKMGSLQTETLGSGSQCEDMSSMATGTLVWSPKMQEWKCK